jgi:hypothetical protein
MDSPCYRDRRTSVAHFDRSRCKYIYALTDSLDGRNTILHRPCYTLHILCLTASQLGPHRTHGFHPVRVGSLVLLDTQRHRISWVAMVCSWRRYGNGTGRADLVVSRRRCRVVSLGAIGAISALAALPAGLLDSIQRQCNRVSQIPRRTMLIGTLA